MIENKRKKKEFKMYCRFFQANRNIKRLVLLSLSHKNRTIKLYILTIDIMYPDGQSDHKIDQT